MSDIDAIQNVHVADLKINISVYWPLENVRMNKIVRNTEGKMLTPEHLLVGGGAGEHPALVIYSDAVVLQALIYNSFFDEPESFEGHDPDVVEFFKQNERLHDKYSYDIFDAIRGSWSMNTNNWPLLTWGYFVEELKKDNLLLEDNPERVMMDMFAAFIINKMPVECLMDKDIRDMVVLYHKNKVSLKSYIKQDYIDKLLAYFTDPQKDEMCGMIHKDGKTCWGYNLSQWKKDQK